MTTVEVEPLVEDAEEEVGPRVQARACARTDALGVGEQHQRHDLVDEHVVDRLSQVRALVRAQPLLGTSCRRRLRVLAVAHHGDGLVCRAMSFQRTVGLKLRGLSQSR